MDYEISREVGEKEESKKKKENQRLSWLLAILSVLVVISVFYVTRRSSNVPPELIGVWKTTSPEYTDRFLEIQEVTISFGTGDAKELTGFIKDIQAIPENDRIMYTITYSSNGQDQKVSFSFAPNEHNTLRFKNQENVVWSRE